MVSSIVRGMPYATMHYSKDFSGDQSSEPILLPSLASEVSVVGQPLVDGKASKLCANNKGGHVRVERELQVTFDESDFTWLVFFSEPVLISCTQHAKSAIPDGPPGPPVAGPNEPSGAILQVIDLAPRDEGDDASTLDTELLTIRVALLNNCTYGLNPIHCGQRASASLVEEYGHRLRKHANFYPGPDSFIDYSVEDDKDEASISLDWDVQDMTAPTRPKVAELPRLQLRKATEDPKDPSAGNLLMFALSHHMDIWSDDSPTKLQQYCTPSLIGPSCLVAGAKWIFSERLPPTSFRAPRPPRPEAIPSIAASLKEDLQYRLPHYYRRGAGDTYFSGKMLAKAGRILMIADELTELCTAPRKASYPEAIDHDTQHAYVAACQGVVLPTRREFNDMLSSLRDAVEIWINGKAETPFVYDSSWGGTISCGCDFDSKTDSCHNKFPDCPIASDPGLNFGNGKKRRVVERVVSVYMF